MLTPGPIMVDRQTEAPATSGAKEAETPLLETDLSSTITSQPPTVKIRPPSTSPSPSTVQHTADTQPGRQRRSRSKHSSQSSSASGSSSTGSDLELEEMRHDDPLHANSAEQNMKMDTAHRSWRDTLLEPEDNDTNAHDHDSKEARRLGSKQFIEKTVINAVLIALWYLLSISMSVVSIRPFITRDTAPDTQADIPAV